MIPHSSAGVQPWGHPLRAVHSASGRADIPHALGQSNIQSEQSSMPVQQSQTGPLAVIDLTANGGEAQEREHPAKRLRLDIHNGSNARDGSPASAGVGEPRSTPISTSSKPPSLSWRGRPVWSFQALLSEVPGAGEPNVETTAAAAQDAKPLSPPAFPAPPWKHGSTDPTANSAAGAREAAPVKEVQTTPYHIEVPSVAPILKGDKVAGFWPWTGNHPEDVLNEQTAKQGYYDRTQVSQNESNTARPSLYAQLKHRSGLQMLSSVFAAALEKRQGHSMVTAPSTFKPPPRVTLTDNKREAWLRDLANPTVPLRKLSRTIPHGIRGRVLLDQCLTKWVPVGRAVWLAKCVGANEIRAFKRKGTSGALAVGLEAKWVRDWTTNVQQFLDGVITSCGVADWKLKMTYAVSLTARLFFEQLLDHDQYLGWFLSSLEAASLNTLPVWLLMLGIYWNHILRYRKRGRRLAELLLEKLSQANKLDSSNTLRPLADRLSLYIRKLTLEHTSSAVLPHSWDKYKDLLSSCLNMKDSVHRAVIQNLTERNARVQRPMKSQETTHQPPQQRVIQLFDSIRSTHDVTSVSIASLGAIDDKAALVFKLLEWVSTPFRHGTCRVYTGARLLRKWKVAGVDVDSCIISFLAEDHHGSHLNINSIYHIISELVRSQTFSVGRYLQWLMAKGVTDYSRDPRQHHEHLSDDLELLLQLPVSRLPDHVRNLRNTLLHRAGIEVSKEEAMIAALKASIAQRLPNIFPNVADTAMSCDVPQSELTWAVKSEIGQWIRRGLTEDRRGSAGKFQMAIGQPVLSAEEFYSIRDILEGYGDLSMLADVLKQTTNCDDGIILASAADTVSYHFQSFSVIGASTDLFRRFVESYARLKRLGVTSLDLIFSLIDLGLHLPGESNTVTLLRQDLCRIESKSFMAAPSPLSDHISAAFNETDSLSPEKLDQLLFSGGGMDESTMDAIFNALITSLGRAEDPAKLSANGACRYLAYLRPFHPKHFDIMLVRWICGLLKLPTRTILSRVLPPLIGVGCVTIQAFVFLVRRLLQSQKVTSMIPNPNDLKIYLLQLLVPPPEGQGRYFDLVTYRFHLSQREFLFKHPEETFNIIRDAIALIDSQSQDDDCCHGRMDLRHNAMVLLQILLTRNPESAVQYCMEKLINQHSTSMMVLTKALDRILGFDTGPEPPNVSVAEKVIELTNDFSLPFCQLKLQTLFNAEAGSNMRNEIVDVMFKAAIADTRSRRSNWVGLVRLMNQDAVRQIRERAEKSFFVIPLFEESNDGRSMNNGSSLETAKLYLTIIEKLAYSIPDSGVQGVSSVLVEKMDLLLHKLVSMQTCYNGSAELRHGVDPEQMIQSRTEFERSLAFWFSALLRMIVLHRSAFSIPSAPKSSTSQEQTRLLISIFCITLARLPDSVLRLFPTTDYFPHSMRREDHRPCPGILLQTHALDVAASLIDTFSDEVRHQCARFLKEKCSPFAQSQNDSRFLYLLGPLGDGPTLNATLPVSLPSPAASGSTPAPTPSGSLAAGLPNPPQPASASLGVPTGLPEGLDYGASHLCLQYRGRAVGAYPVRPWELLEDAAPIAGTNDTAVSLGYFDARRVRA